MASKIDVSALSINAQEVTQITKAIFEKIFKDPQLSRIHRIETGIIAQEQIVFISQLEIGGQKLVSCTPAEIAGLFLTESFWDPQLIAGRLKHCAADLNKLLKIFARAKKATPDFFDRIGSEEIGILIARVASHIVDSVNAKIWFGAKNAAVQPGGDFTIIGFNAEIWNQFDGLWEQIFTNAELPAIPRFTITANAGATFALQALPAGESLKIFRGVHNISDARLLGEPSAQYICTRSIWNNFVDLLEDKQLDSGGFTRETTDGQVSIKYRNIPIILYDGWDRIIEKFQNDLTVTVLPHRLILTVPDNIPIGTLNTSDMTNIESFYDKKDKENIIDYSYFLDVKFLENYMATVAF